MFPKVAIMKHLQHGAWSDEQECGSDVVPDTATYGSRMLH